MARGGFHRVHAQDRAQRNRYLIAREAARLISEHGIHDFRHAKRKAARRLGIRDDQALPRNREIDAALREHQRLFLADRQPQALRERRAAAVQAMDFFSRFHPRLVGPVLHGTADEHSAVQLQLFCADVEEFARFLHEHAIPAQQKTRRVRANRDTWEDYPVFLLSADELPFDLAVLPPDLLRQAPLDPLDERPMTRANRAAVQALVDADE